MGTLFRRSARRGSLTVLGGLALGLATLAALPPRSASATVLAQLSLSDMAARSAHVLVGTVEQLRPQLLPGQGVIVTEVTVRCTRSLRGVREGQILTVRHLGGTVNGIGQRVFGEASYRVGEEVLLLAEERSGSFYAVGMAQGALHIDRSSGAPRVHVQLEGAELLAPSGQVVAQPAAEGAPLDQVVAELAALLARTPAPGGK
jgi:hypothetical protein